ncbi:hypothetical protein Tsubulata_005574 [Turnera subulata]|uniref:Cytochrome P450 n=1 Tax=Turnera subulata TaxID=218843 RepID=A0A9Q0F461_9ROSI|nr:hypothetical protein Tsubulata_005574 [Turnera subulata]
MEFSSTAFKDKFFSFGNWISRQAKINNTQKDNIYPYRFLHGDTKEITSMRNGAITKSMKISHQIPRIQPHVYSWTKLYEPELEKEVMNDKDGTILKAMIQNYADKLLGNGVFASQGEKWMKMRKLANVDSLKGMIPAVIVNVEIMLERWRGRGEEIEEPNIRDLKFGNWGRTEAR